MTFISSAENLTVQSNAIFGGFDDFFYPLPTPLFPLVCCLIHHNRETRQKDK